MIESKYKNIVMLCLATVAIYFSIDLPALAGGLFQSGGVSLGSNGLSLNLGGSSSNAGGIAEALCNIVGWFTGGVGQAIASLAVIFLGISAFFGKVTWGTALMFAVGIFAIFGSSDIVKAIIDGTSGGVNVSLGSGGLGVSWGKTSCGGF